MILDQYGYPVTGFKGRTITNLIRKIIHGNILKTFSKNNKWIKLKNGGCIDLDMNTTVDGCGESI